MHHRIQTLAVIVFVATTSALPAYAQDMPAAYKEVMTFLGKQGDFKDNVLKVNIPRNDVTVTVANVATPTPFGFGGWIALTKGSGMDVMMGDLGPPAGRSQPGDVSAARQRTRGDGSAQSLLLG